MTFEGFDAALPIATSDLALWSMEEMILGPDKGGQTLQAALRQSESGNSGIEGIRDDFIGLEREALVLDLWVRASDVGRSHIVTLADRPLPAASVGRDWLSLTYDTVPPLDGDMSFTKNSSRASFGDPGPGEYVDENGNGQWDPGEEQTVTVTGRRPNEVDDDGSGWEPNPGDDIGGGIPGGMGGPDLPAEDEEPNDCRDRKALEAQAEIKGHNDDNQREHGVIVYRGADGQVHKSDVLHGDADSIPREVITNWMTQNGVSFAQVIGFVHNHDAWQYGTSDEEAAVNRFPSGNDWNAAAWMVSQGAGGANGADFALYVMDTTGDMREFDYADRQKFESLSRDEKRDGDELPDELVSDGSSC